MKALLPHHQEITMRSEIGTEFYQPNHYFFLELIPFDDKPPSWAERRRDNIIYKLRARRKFRIMFFRTILFLLWIVFVLSLLAGFLMMFGNYVNTLSGMMLGYCGAMGIWIGALGIYSHPYNAAVKREKTNDWT